MNWQDGVTIAACAFWWGDLCGEWWEKRRSRGTDPAFRLLYGMVAGILEKRKFVGPALQITREEKLEINGERFTLSLRSDGSPITIDGEIA